MSEPLPNFPKTVLHSSSFPRRSVCHLTLDLGRSVLEAGAILLAFLVRSPARPTRPALLTGPTRPALYHDDALLDCGDRAERMRDPVR
jgi:hypothetical protein